MIGDAIWDHEERGVKVRTCPRAQFAGLIRASRPPLLKVNLQIISWRPYFLDEEIKDKRVMNAPRFELGDSLPALCIGCLDGFSDFLSGRVLHISHLTQCNWHCLFPPCQVSNREFWLLAYPLNYAHHSSSQSVCLSSVSGNPCARLWMSICLFLQLFRTPESFCYSSLKCTYSWLI